MNDYTKKLNEIMPKIPNMKWGAITNTVPTDAKIRQLNKMLPHDEKWHSLFESKNKIEVDGVPINRKSAESMT